MKPQDPVTTLLSNADGTAVTNGKEWLRRIIVTDKPFNGFYQSLDYTYWDRSGALPTLAHYLLLSLPVRLVLTTNYDELLEMTLTALKRYPVKVVQQRDVPRIRAS